MGYSINERRKNITYQLKNSEKEYTSIRENKNRKKNSGGVFTLKIKIVQKLEYINIALD